MAKRALITGITGQDGSYLAELLLAEGYEVVGLMRRSSTVNIERISHIQDRLILVSGDLMDEVSLINVLREHRPQEVYNLAAQSFVQASWVQPVLTGESTALGVTRMLDAIRIVDPAIRFYQASSSEMFGRVRAVPGTSTRRSGRAAPTCAKVYGHWITGELPRELRLARVERDPLQPRVATAWDRVRHAQSDSRRGPNRRRPRARGAPGQTEARRDWGYAFDYVRAMWLMLQRDEPDDYVIATGETHSVRELCEVAFARVGLDWQDHVVVDEKFLRPAEGGPARGRRRQGHSRAGVAPRDGLPRADRAHGRRRPQDPPALVCGRRRVGSAAGGCGRHERRVPPPRRGRPRGRTPDPDGGDGRERCGQDQLVAAHRRSRRTERRPGRGLWGRPGWRRPTRAAPSGRVARPRGLVLRRPQRRRNFVFAARALERPSPPSAPRSSESAWRPSPRRPPARCRRASAGASALPGCSCAGPSCGCSTSPTRRSMPRAATFSTDSSRTCARPGPPSCSRPMTPCAARPSPRAPSCSPGGASSRTARAVRDDPHRVARRG